MNDLDEDAMQDAFMVAHEYPRAQSWQVEDGETRTVTRASFVGQPAEDPHPGRS